MHEVSLVRDMLGQVRQTIQEYSVDRVTAIHLEIGPLSGVDACLVEQAFCSLIRDTEFEDTQLLVQQPPLMAVCLDCQRSLEVLDFKFICPECHSRRVQVISGDQMRLVDITAECREDEGVSCGVNRKGTRR